MTVNELNWQQPPPPPPPDATNTYVPARPVATAPFVLGIVATFIGLIPLLCIPALICALIGLPLAVIAYRHRPRKRLSRAAIVMCLVGLTFSIIGFVIMNNVMNDVDKSINDINNVFVTTTR
jgi:multisubunit Na+/H+ antiporter MnhB subunit